VKASSSILLDPTLRSNDEVEFEQDLKASVVGQEEAVTKVARCVQKHMSGLVAPHRPICNLLLLGPTGTGKTRLVEAVSEKLFGADADIIKIDCSEFQASHDISKIVGAPPGYVGHNDKNTKPLIDQEILDKHIVDGKKLAIVLFDEIEKANLSLWNLLLGITDKARLTTGSGNVLDFTNSMIFMTSNLGSASMAKQAEGGMGFGMGAGRTSNKQLASAAIEAARRNFSPEFMNRLDDTIVFHTLLPAHLLQILRIELLKVQRRIIASSNHIKFVFHCDSSAEAFLIKTGFHARDNARHLKRAIETWVVDPLSSLILSGQLETGDTVILSHLNDKLNFAKIPAEIIASHPVAEWEDLRPACATE
jgi:ATP-dependent Clp protease ATP-binding subunit ClpB